MRHRARWLAGAMILFALAIDGIMAHHSLAITGLLVATQTAGGTLAWIALRSHR